MLEAFSTAGDIVRNNSELLDRNSEHQALTHEDIKVMKAEGKAGARARLDSPHGKHPEAVRQRASSLL